MLSNARVVGSSCPIDDSVLCLAHLLMAVQERAADLAAFTFAMIEMLGRDSVTIPPTPSGYIVFLEQFAALPCASCQKRLCPSCLCGGMLRTGCVYCRYTNQRTPVNFDVGPLESVVDKLHAATVLAAIPHLGASSDMEFSLTQQIVLGSAKKMQRDTAAGQPVIWIGLSLREFCRAVESFPGRPINHSVLQEIRQLCDACVPKPLAQETIREFQDTVKLYVSTGA